MNECMHFLPSFLERHTINGITRYLGKNKFNEGEDVIALISQTANQHAVSCHIGSNIARTFDTGREIGVDNTTGEQTSVITIVTNAIDDLITTFPGRP